MVLMIISVGAGGALGAIARYLVGVLISQYIPQHGWLATVSVNVTGCFIMGAIAAIIAEMPVLSPALRGFIMVGFLGALTTFSSFALDVHLLSNKHGMMAGFGYIFASVGLSLMLFFAGLWLFRSSGAQ